MDFFSALLALFFQTLGLQQPKLQPDLVLKPMPPAHNTLIHYKLNDSSYASWTNELDDFLEPYRKPDPESASVRQACDFNTPDTPDKVCQVNMKEDRDRWLPCTKEKNYLYDKGSPCIFLKLNEVFGWIPEFYNNSETLPINMPDDLKNYIRQEQKYHSKYLNVVWVTCEGVNLADKENIGAIQYIPRRGFPGYYFPYKNQEGYLSPLVAIWFEKPATGVPIKIECKAWARNIHHDGTEGRGRGSVQFELMIDQ